MSSLLESLTQQLGGDNLGQMSRALGADEKATGAAVAAALPTLLGALARNASTESGAASLAGALEKDHDGSMLDNLTGLLGGAGASGAPGGRAADGTGILRHLLGAKQPRVEQGVAKASGLDEGSTAKLLAMLAPIVMAQLGKQQRQQNLGAGGLAGLLSQERKKVEAQSPQAAGLLGALLDADGDGDVDVADMIKQGGGMLGKLFGGR